MTALQAASAAVLAALALLVLARERQPGRLGLAFGALLLSATDMIGALAARSGFADPALLRAALACESLVPAVFIAYGFSLTRPRGSGLWRAVLPALALGSAFVAVAAAAPLETIYPALDRRDGSDVALGPVGYWHAIGVMIMLVAALVNVESVLGGTRGTARWRVKFELLGVGGALAASIVLFSRGLLYRGLDLSLLPARSAVWIVAALLIGYSRLHRSRGTTVALSRQAVYRSFVLIGVGLYFLALGLLAQLGRGLGLSMPQGLVAFAAILMGLLFVVLLLSEEVRRRARVFVSKHFFAHKHDYREQWLGFSRALAGCGDLPSVAATILARYRECFGLRHAGLYLRGADSGGAFARSSSWGFDGLPPELPMSPGHRGYYLRTGRVLDPRDGEYTPTEQERAFLERARAWLLVPLLAGERLEGVVLLGERSVPEPLDFEDYDLMRTLGRQAALSLANFRLSEELAEAREVAAIGKVSSFVVHDLKNLSYGFSLMIENAERHISEPAFQGDLVRSLRGNVGKMNDLIARLRAFPGKLELRPAPTDLAALVSSVVREVREFRGGVRFETRLGPARADVDPAEFRKVPLNLILNACDATADSGRVEVATATDTGEVRITVRDDGAGMSPSFVKRHLFKPFRTTKDEGLGIGLHQSRQIVEAHGGRIEVSSVPDEGSEFTVILQSSA